MLSLVLRKSRGIHCKSGLLIEMHDIVIVDETSQFPNQYTSAAYQIRLVVHSGKNGSYLCRTRDDRGEYAAYLSADVLHSYSDYNVHTTGMYKGVPTSNPT